ncbi:MAG: hypothetical protein GVY14_04280 [Spirochaetes bacterium]|nr:hypothetical protein [Spirochaetota bacterium]
MQFQKRADRSTRIRPGRRVLVVVLVLAAAAACGPNTESAEDGPVSDDGTSQTIAIGVEGISQFFVYSAGEGITEVDNGYDVIKGTAAVRDAGYHVQSGSFGSTETTRVTYENGNTSGSYRFLPDQTVIVEFTSPAAMAGEQTGHWMTLSE